jgi:hypothetical protein
MTAESLKQFISDGYKPACVIESSPGNFQVVLNVPKFAPDDPDERSRANRLTRELNRVYGDKNLSGAEHAHRMPGFPNYKLKHRKVDGTFPESTLLEAEGVVCEKAEMRLIEIRREDLRRAEREREMERNASSLPGSVVDAYWKHYDNILEHQGIPDDFSRLDAMIALRLKITGHTQSSIQSAIEICAPQIREQCLSGGDYAQKYGARNWKDYAQRTADYAFGGKAAGQESRLINFLNGLLKIEGRPMENENYRRSGSSLKDVSAEVESAARVGESETGRGSKVSESVETVKDALSSSMVFEPENSHRNFVPQIGDRVIFHFKNAKGSKKQSPPGKIIDMDDVKGTVTLENGGSKFTVFRGRGYFVPMKEIPREQSVEYALESAKKLVGESGKVYFASKDGKYKGEILDVGSVYATQKVGKNTVVLHLLKDCDNVDMLQKGAEVVVTREIGRSFVSENTQKKAGGEQSLER